MNWFPEGDQLLVQRQSRNQKRLDLLSFPVTGGSGRLLFSETSDTWVDLHDDLYFLPRRKELLWASQRTGHNHLYRYGYDGRLKGAVTAGDWDVLGESQAPAVRGIDEKRGRVYFMATLKTPLERQLYVASLDAGSAARAAAADVTGRLAQRHDVAGRAALSAGLQRPDAAAAAFAARRDRQAARLAASRTGSTTSIPMRPISTGM